MQVISRLLNKKTLKRVVILLRNLKTAPINSKTKLELNIFKNIFFQKLIPNC